MQFKNLHKNKSQKSILPFQLSKVPLTLILGCFVRSTSENAFSAFPIWARLNLKGYKIPIAKFK